MDHEKWKMSKKDMNSFIKSLKDYETGLDSLIIEQQITLKKILTDSKERWHKLL